MFNFKVKKLQKYMGSANEIESFELSDNYMNNIHRTMGRPTRRKHEPVIKVVCPTYFHDLKFSNQS